MFPIYHISLVSGKSIGSCVNISFGLMRDIFWKKGLHQMFGKSRRVVIGHDKEKYNNMSYCCTCIDAINWYMKCTISTNHLISFWKVKVGILETRLSYVYIIYRKTYVCAIILQINIFGALNVKILFFFLRVGVYIQICDVSCNTVSWFYLDVWNFGSLILNIFSSGVGRTGYFIALDLSVDEGNEDHSVDVSHCVTRLREQRVNMVQSEVENL